jgi:hypothetical protein
MVVVVVVLTPGQEAMGDKRVFLLLQAEPVYL